MFSGLIFLILNLLLFTSSLDQRTWPLFSDAPVLALTSALYLYAALLVVVYIQNHWLSKKLHFSKQQALLVNQFEILFFFTAFYFAFGSQRLFLSSFSPFGQTAALSFSLILYFLGLLLCHLSLEKSHKTVRTKINHAINAVRFIAPFALPFLFFVFLGEIEALIPFIKLANLFRISSADTLQATLTLIINIIAIIAAAIFLPPIALYIWKCPALKDTQLAADLNALCQKAGFSHAGLKIWTIMHDACTAAIVGVVAPFRYILFTPKLLHLLSPEAIKAVLAHEIGHSRRHHLVIYPFILLGMAVVGSAALIVVYDILQQFDLNALIAESPALEALTEFFSYLFFAAVIAVYFRFVFGYFSRAFERQADLNIFELDIPVEHMVEALDTLAVAAGNIHNKPDWHHHSIQERISFLEKAQKHPSLIAKHNRHTFYSLIVYAFLLVCLSAYLIAQILYMR